MKITTSYLVAGLALIGIALWFLFNTLFDGTAAPAPKQAEKPQASLPTVVTQMRWAEDHPNVLKLFAKTTASREVDVKAETAGRVIATPAKKGHKVKRSALLCRQDINARQANLDQALATLKAREFDYNSTKILVEKGFQAAIKLESQKAAVDGARASVKQAEIELDNVNMRAPFTGVLDAQIAEVGDYLSPGQPCARIVQLDPLFVTINLTENQVGNIKRGQEVSLSLVTGEAVTGKVHFIEAKANDATGTFYTEISVPNPDYALKGGVTATANINIGTVKAQQIPAKILSLNDEGLIGVRYVGYDNRVVFATVTTIDEDPDGIWVTGLPDEARIIIEGQEYVSDGTQVNPITATADKSKF